MRHERVAALLSDYLEGALSARDASRLEAHLLGCGECRQALGELRRTVGLLRGLRGTVDAPDVATAVMARIRAGEAEASRFDRMRAGVSRFLSGPLGAPLATAAVGLMLLAVLPRIEVEVSIPSRVPREARAVVAAPPARGAGESQHSANPPLISRRVNESLSRDPFTCREAPSIAACREHHAYMTRLAMENVQAFMEQLQAMPEPGREVLLGELSRFANESGEAPDVAAHLRATGDPLAQRVAMRFEEAR